MTVRRLVLAHLLNGLADTALGQAARSKLTPYGEIIQPAV
jgi:hypothetical protein